MELSGRLGEHFLPDLLQGLSAFGRSGHLHLEDDRGVTAQIGFERGQPRWAVCGHRAGEEAVLACLFWQAGQFLFREGGEMAVPHPQALLPPGWDLTRFLLRAMYLADELEKRRPLVPGRADPLEVGVSEPPEDPFQVGVAEVYAYVNEHQPITREQLERALPLAPIAVRLALAWLVERGALKAPRRETRSESSDRHSRWWAQLASRYGGSFRVLIAVPQQLCTRETLSRLVSFLSTKLKASDPWISFSSSGPSFVRFRPPGGGVLSLCCLPIGRDNGNRDCLAFTATQDLVVALGDVDSWCVETARGFGKPVKVFRSLDELLESFTTLGVEG